MTQQQNGQHDPELLAALAGKSADIDRRVAGRARRAINSTIAVMSERKELRRRNRALAIVLVAGIMLIAAPLLWIIVDGIMSGEHIGDLTSHISLLALLIIPAFIAALFAGSGRSRGNT